MEIIPAIDVLGNACVRLYKGNFSSAKVYSNDALGMAKNLSSLGVKRLHLVDLEGARSGKIKILDLVKKIINETELKIDFGGGVKTDEDVDALFEIGVSQINIGTIAGRDSHRFKSWLRQYGPEKFILSADAKNGEVMVSGWQDGLRMKVEQFIKQFESVGLKYVTCTSIEQDGTLNGPDVEMYRNLKEKMPNISIIASGGVSSVNQFRLLEEIGIWGVIVGKAWLEGCISVQEMIKNAN